MDHAPQNISLRLPFTLRFLKAEALEVTVGSKKLTAKEVEQLRAEIDYAVSVSERFRHAQSGWKKQWNADTDAT